MSIVKVFLDHQEQQHFVGRLVFNQGIASIALDENFLALDLHLSPLKLKPTTQLQTAPRHPFDGLHGVFADSLPDGWGLLLMDRRLAQQGINYSQITTLQRLSYMGSRTMGALTYQPDSGASEHDHRLLSLTTLANNAIEIYQGSSKDVSQQLHLTGGSPGGARPKAIIGLSADQAIAGAHDLPPQYQHWLIKFPTNNKGPALAEGAIEYIYSLLAKQAGINFGETKLIEAKGCHGYFAAKRFDRIEAMDGSHHNQKVHMHTLAGLLHADFRLPDCDYQLLLKATNYVTRSHQDCVEAFRRMIFNIVVGNKDDHSKNFSYLLSADGSWRLSPAYDITFNSGINGHHSMSISGEGQNISNQAIMAVAKLISLNQKQVNSIIQQVTDAASQWPKLARQFAIPYQQLIEIENHITNQIKRLS